MISEETQRVCGSCGHVKRGHALPRSEGGHGGGTDGHCVTFGCHCRQFASTEEYEEQAYVGNEVPSWVKEGVKVKVKATPETRKYGIRAPGGGHADSHVFAGEIGTIGRHDGIGWWDWRVHFARGRSLGLDEETLAQLKKTR